MKPIMRSSIWLVCLFALTPFHAADAAILAEQPFDAAAVGEYSNLGPSNQQVADDFLLAQAVTLDSILWYGRYGANLGVSNPVDFSIRLFEDAGGSPETVPVHVISAAVDAVDTGSAYGNSPWFSYLLSLPGLTLGPGTYWLSVLEDDANTGLSGDSQWLWADSDTSGIRATRDADGVAWSAGSDWNHAFTLTGTPVPEPATMLLLGAGLLGVSGMRRRSAG